MRIDNLHLPAKVQRCRSLRRARADAGALLLALMLFVPAARAADPLSAATLAEIRSAAMQSGYAQQEVFTLADQIGPRLAGSTQAHAAAAQIAAALKQLGLKIRPLPVQVPHWVRGTARAEIVRYAGRPHGVHQRLRVAALGNSPATPAAGITAPVVIVHSFSELQAHAKEIAGRIVVFDVPFDQQLANAGYAATAYARFADYRTHGPARAAALGAVAALLRSGGSAHYRIVHTGATLWPQGSAGIPAAMLSDEDADLLAALAAKGPVRLELQLTPDMKAPVRTRDVVADIEGRTHPEQIVLVSGHYDSWDLGTGAQDDATGVAAAMGVAAVLQQLGLRPRRTIRIVAWANEENGLSGATAYAKAMARSVPDHVAAIENDTGAGRPLGIAARVDADSIASLAPVFDALKPIGASLVVRTSAPVAADIQLLGEHGVPGFSPLVDMRHYFDIHHSAADTYDKIKPQNLRRQVAVEAVLAWWLANAHTLPHAPRAEKTALVQ